jgi:hypothetical protein
MSTAYHEPPSAVYKAGLSWRAVGAQVVPVTEDGLKTPDYLTQESTTDPDAMRAKWTQHRKTWIEHETFEAVFGADSRRTGFGLVTGIGFRNDGLKLGMIEIDSPDLYQVVLDTAEAAGVDIIGILNAGCVERTPGGGYHFYYWCADIPGNTKLAARPTPTKHHPRQVDVLIETRGTGGFSIAAPSHGNVHLTGKPYQELIGSPETTPVIMADQQREMFDFLRVFDEREKKEVKPRVKDATVDGDRPGDRYNDDATLDTFLELLPGWHIVYTAGKVTYLRRPDKERGISASWNWDGCGKLRVFTTSTDLEPEMYSAFALLTHRKHNGDWSACAKALYAEGYGKRAYQEFDFSGDGPPEGSGAVKAIQLTDTLRVADNRFWVQQDFAPIALTNFEARISHYVTEVTGPGDVRRSYRMVGKLHNGPDLPAVDIPTDDLGLLHLWPGRSGPLWSRATLEPGFAVRDQARACIQHYSQRVGVESISRYSETGWCRIDDQWIFRTHTAAIGLGGVRSDVDVQLDADFNRYALPVLSEDDNVKALAQRYLRTLDMAPDQILAPLILAPTRAILAEILPVDSAIYLYGGTGNFKTELSVIAMAHFGATFTSRSIPLNFEGTSNSTEAATWRLKDVVTVVDDMVPDGSKGQVEATYAKLSRLARSIGNRSGRTRSNADMTAKQTYYPRGVIIASGEDVPHGQSASARLQVIEVPAGAVSVDVLTDCQALAREGVYAKLTAVFIQRIAKDWNSVSRNVELLYQRALSDMRLQPFKHRRTGDAIAPQIVAAQSWFEFLRTTGAITAAERDDYIERMRTGLLATGEAQDDIQAEASPVDVFVGNIRSAVVRGDAHLADRESNDLPIQAARFGWKTETRKLGDHIEPVSIAKGSLIGWVDIEADAAYLDPTSAFAVAQKLGAFSGRIIPTTINTLGKRLDDANMLVSAEAGRTKQKIYVSRQSQRVWHFRLSLLFPDREAQLSEPLPFERSEVSA